MEKQLNLQDTKHEQVETISKKSISSALQGNKTFKQKRNVKDYLNLQSWNISTAIKCQRKKYRWKAWNSWNERFNENQKKELWQDKKRESSSKP